MDITIYDKHYHIINKICDIEYYTITRTVDKKTIRVVYLLSIVQRNNKVQIKFDDEIFIETICA